EADSLFLQLRCNGLVDLQLDQLRKVFLSQGLAPLPLPRGRNRQDQRQNERPPDRFLHSYHDCIPPMAPRTGHPSEHSRTHPDRGADFMEQRLFRILVSRVGMPKLRARGRWSAERIELCSGSMAWISRTSRWPC